jgi:PKD repeat protein
MEKMNATRSTKNENEVIYNTRFKLKTRAVFMLLFAIFSSFYLQAQITGPANACYYTQSTFTVANASNLTAVWTVSSNGSIVSFTNTTCNVYWLTNNATATVSVSLNGAAAIVKTVNVQKAPKPYISFTNQVGCQVLIEEPPHTIDDDPIPIPLIPDGQCLKVCENSGATYSVIGTAGSSYVWSISGGTINGSVTGTTCTVVWLTSGSGYVQVTETNTGGCSTTKQICIEKVKSPTANFNVIGYPLGSIFINACVNQALYFNDLSNINGGTLINNWYWDFGDGTSSSLQNPNHNYTVSGIYNVTLTVTNLCNCNSIKRELQVKVSEEPPAEISCVSTTCENDINLYTTNSQCATNTWQITGGQIVVGGVPSGTSISNVSSIQVVWDAITPNNLGTIIFTPSCLGICNSPTVLQIPILRKIGIVEAPAYMCIGEQYLIRVPQYSGTTYKWSYRSGTASMIKYDQPNERYITPTNGGTIIVNVEYTNKYLECSGFASATIQVTSKPTISGSAIICKGSAQTYTLSLGTGDWVIKKGSTVVATATATSSITLTAAATIANGAGGYDVSVVPSASCPPDLLTVEVLNQPAAPTSIIGDLAPCAGIPVTYTAAPPQSGSIFVWTIVDGLFANGSTSFTTTSAIVTAIWNASTPTGRKISVKRKLVSNPFCESVNFDLLVGLPASIANFITTGSATFVTVQASNTTTTANYYGTSLAGAEDYQWSLSNPAAGSIVSGQGTQFIQIQWNCVIVNPSTTLLLKIKQCNVTSTTALVSPTINITSPIPTITSPVGGSTSICDGASVTFNINSSNTAAIASAFGSTINYGDGTIEQFSALNTFPSHTYNNTSSADVTYPVTVTLTNINGCGAAGNVTLIGSVLVKPAPIGTISPSGDKVYPCGANSATLRTFTPSNITTGLSYQWTKGGVNVGTNSPNYTTVNGQFGNYKVRVTGSNTCSKTTDAFNIASSCGSLAGCIPDRSVTFTATSACDVISVTNASFPVILNPNPVNPVAASNLVFNTLPNLTPITPVPAPNPSSISTIQYKADIAGSYTLSLNVNLPEKLPYSFGGTCVAYNGFSNPVIVYYVPRFTHALACNTSSTGYNIVVTNTSTYHSNPITNYTYKLYAAGTSTPVLQTLTSTTNGNVTFLNLTPSTNYDIEQTITGTVGASTVNCTYKRTNITTPGPLATVSFTTNPSAVSVCMRTPITFTSAVTNGTNLSWDFASNITTPAASQGTSILANPIKTYDAPSNPNYVIKLSAKNTFGCITTATATKTILTNPYEVSNGVVAPTYSPTPACAGTTLALNYNNTVANPAPTVSSYLWVKQPGNVVISSPSASNAFNVFQAGAYATFLTHSNTCRKLSDYKAVIYNETPDATIYGKSDVCVGEAFVLNGYVGPINPPSITNITYSWDKKNTNGTYTQIQTGSNQLLNVAANPSPGTLIYRLRISITSTVNGASIVCSNTSADFSVVVNPSPNAPILNASMTNCNNYTINLTATNTATGIFSWSNYMSGASINVNNGGIYKCTFINSLGCKASNTIVVPKDPESYLWIFPSGCYHVCDEDLPYMPLSSPIVPFLDWNYINNNTSTSVASATVHPSKPIPYTIPVMTGGGSFSLNVVNDYLGTAWCQRQTKPANINVQECTPLCNISGNVNTAGATTAVLNTNGACVMQFSITFTNPQPNSQTIHITSQNGALWPVASSTGSLVLAPATTTTYSFYFVPNPTANLGLIYFDFVNYNLTNNNGYCKFQANLSNTAIFPNCGTAFTVGKLANLSQNEILNVLQSEVKLNGLIQFSPNPANAELNVNIDLDNVSSLQNASIRITQIGGKVVWEEKIEGNDKHTYTINTSSFGNGMYEVAVYNKQQKISNKKLSIMHD